MSFRALFVIGARGCKQGEGFLFLLRCGDGAEAGHVLLLLNGENPCRHGLIGACSATCQ